MSDTKPSTAADTNPISRENLEGRIKPLIDEADSLRALPDTDPRKTRLSRIVDQINQLRAVQDGNTNQFPTNVAVAREQGADATELYAQGAGKSFPNVPTEPFQVIPEGAVTKGIPGGPSVGDVLVQESHVDPVYQPPNPPNNPPETATVAAPGPSFLPPDVRNAPQVPTSSVMPRVEPAEELVARAGTVEESPTLKDKPKDEPSRDGNTLDVPDSAKAPKKKPGDK